MRHSKDRVMQSRVDAGAAVRLAHELFELRTCCLEPPRDASTVRAPCVQASSNPPVMLLHVLDGLASACLLSANV